MAFIRLPTKCISPSSALQQTFIFLTLTLLHTLLEIISARPDTEE